MASVRLAESWDGNWMAVGGGDGTLGDWFVVFCTYLFMFCMVPWQPASPSCTLSHKAPSVFARKGSQQLTQEILRTSWSTEHNVSPFLNLSWWNELTASDCSSAHLRLHQHIYRPFQTWGWPSVLKAVKNTNYIHPHCEVYGWLLSEPDFSWIMPCSLASETINERGTYTTVHQISKIIMCKALNEEGLPYWYRHSLNYEISDLCDFKKREKYHWNNLFFKACRIFPCGNWSATRWWRENTAGC